MQGSGGWFGGEFADRPVFVVQFKVILWIFGEFNCCGHRRPFKRHLGQSREFVPVKELLVSKRFGSCLR